MSELSSINLRKQRVALTGGLTLISRDEFRTRVADVGGIFVANMDDEIDVLVTGDRPMVGRVEKAKRLGITVIDEVTFVKAAHHAPAPARPLTIPITNDAARALTSSIEVTGPYVRILDVVLPRQVHPEPLAPPLELFRHFTMDEPTTHLLRFLARSVMLRQPVLIEGETATSKSSAVLYLAALIGQEVIRINLNGQTDTSELIGRYVPNEGPTGGWRFQEGLIPQAMRLGWWVLLDEVNLADPAVLERLNPVLERDPTLVLTEGPGTRFGPGGDASVHEGFRVFATQNPADYQGRSVLSAAFRDRFVATWQAAPAGEREYRQLLERAVFGRQPAIEFGGLQWKGPASSEFPPPHASLSHSPGISGFLERLASLHAGLARMAASSPGAGPSIGAGRRERYQFTRRTLLGVLDALHQLRLVDSSTGAFRTFGNSPDRIALDALEQAYLARVSDEDDRAKVLTLMRSLGLSRDAWLHPLGLAPAVITPSG